MKLAASSVSGPLLVRVGSIYDKLMDMTVPDLREASRVCRAYLEEEGLRSSEWTGGEVLAEASGRCVAVVSYNGRVWVPSETRNPEGQVLADNNVEYDLDV